MFPRRKIQIVIDHEPYLCLHLQNARWQGSKQLRDVLVFKDTPHSIIEDLLQAV